MAWRQLSTVGAKTVGLRSTVVVSTVDIPGSRLRTAYLGSFGTYLHVLGGFDGATRVIESVQTRH